AGPRRDDLGEWLAVARLEVDTLGQQLGLVLWLQRDRIERAVSLASDVCAINLDPCETQIQRVRIRDGSKCSLSVDPIVVDGGAEIRGPARLEHDAYAGRIRLLGLEIRIAQIDLVIRIAD